MLEVEDNRRVTALIAAPLSAAAAAAGPSSSSASSSSPLFRSAIDLLQGEQSGGGRLRDDDVDSSSPTSLQQNGYAVENAAKVDYADERAEKPADSVRAVESLSPPAAAWAGVGADLAASEQVATMIPTAADEGDVLIFRDGEWLEPEEKEKEKGVAMHSSDFSDSSNFT